MTDLLIDGDRVVQLLDVVGTHAGEFLGLPPTGRRLQVVGAFVYTINDHLIVHERRILDFTGVLVQVGVLKAEARAGALESSVTGGMCQLPAPKKTNSQSVWG